jgi:hypothetical protein
VSNKDCGAVSLTERNGCSLWALKDKLCAKTHHPSDGCTANKYVYSSSYLPVYDANSPHGQCSVSHVITIAYTAFRGLEDVYQKLGAANTIVGNHFQSFWHESTSTKTTGSSGNQGFDADKGALVINPAAHREYHQLHIHGGAWRTPKFQECVGKLKPTAAWAKATCTGLTEGGGSGAGQTAHLAYKVIAESELPTVWSLWRAAVRDSSLVTILDSSSKKPLKPKMAAYHAAILVTRTPGLPKNEVVVAVYSPPDNAQANGLGRGHFVMKGNYNDKQTCTCTSTSSTSCKLDP